jgi:aerobic carbon-monoxide dehydrogenase medium subunit
MKAAAFDYVVPRDLGAALSALSQSTSTKVIAGGQSLGPMLNLRIARIERLVDISRLDELKTIDDRSDHWRVGAAVTHSFLEDRAGGFDGLERLARIAGGIAYRAVRNRGTMGGSMAHADPAADWPLALLTLGASVEVAGSKKRKLDATAFIRAPFTTDLSPEEIVSAVLVPKISKRARFGYFKFCRKTGEFAEASAAVLFDPDRKVARIFVGALAGPPKSLPAIADKVARYGIANLDETELSKSVAGLSAERDPVETQMRVSAVKRALKEAFGL